LHLPTRGTLPKVAANLVDRAGTTTIPPQRRRSVSCAISGHMNAANTTNTTRTLCPSVPALGGNKNARGRRRTLTRSARETKMPRQSQKVTLVRLEVRAPEHFLMGAMHGLCQSFHPRHCLQPFFASRWRGPFFACGGSHARRPDAGDCDRRAHAMQFAAFF
jgi:hypothetical protein